MLNAVVLIFIGGGVGSILRYFLHTWTHSTDTVFPVATFLANVIASFLIGLLVVKIDDQILPTQYRYLLITGFCGGLSTFSTFSYENIQMFHQRQFFLSLVYTVISILVCFASTILGIWAAKKIS
ncbi:MAG: fluoride efflux transporter CrcB [Bacteroidia bacterium]|nr:fluoride efflux transporter CrcB [Bacteroidia bacterium]MDW8347097.1 fluoride efflux transporter CrcB [Bacteroidia bacterium]